MYTKPQEHTLYPRPEHRYECRYCGAAGYHYPDRGEVWTYCQGCPEREWGWGPHVWVYEYDEDDPRSGERVFANADGPADAPQA